MSCAADLGGSSIYSYNSSEDRGGMGSMSTVTGHGLADHKMHECSVQVWIDIVREMKQDECSPAIMWISSGDIPRY